MWEWAYDRSRRPAPPPPTWASSAGNLVAGERVGAGRRRSLDRRRVRLPTPAREVDGEAGAGARLAFDGDRAVVVDDDTLYDRKPHAGSLAARLRREERLEKP